MLNRLAPILAALLYSCHPLPAFAASDTRNQIPINGQKGSDTRWPYQSGSNFADAGRTGFGPDVIIHGSATMTGTITVPGLQANGGTVFYPSGYTMPRDNAQGSTVYPGAGAVFATTMSQGPAGSVSVIQPSGVAYTISNTGDIHGTVSLTQSTCGTGNYLANATAVTYTIQVNGTESGVTIFTDVSNADTMPPVTDARQWQTLTPNGIMPVASPTGVLGNVTQNMFYANGYRWMKWRAEAWCPTCGPTVAVMYKATLP